MVFKREDWNNLIDDVNSVLQNPPSGCDPLPPLDHVGPNHRWSKADIEQVHEAIMATCDEISFNSIPDLWRQSTVDEIYEKLSEAWCDCECDLNEALFFDELVLRELEPQLFTECPYGTPPPADLEEKDNLCELLNGMQVGPPNILGRQYAVIRKRTGTSSFFYDYEIEMGRGTVDCFGRIICPSVTMTTNLRMDRYYYEMHHHPGGVITDPCFDQAALDYYDYLMTEFVAHMGKIEYILKVWTTPSLRCQEC